MASGSTPTDAVEHLSPAALVARLRHLEETFPQNLKAACANAGAALVPDLIALIDDTLASEDDALDWPSLYAIELLGDAGDAGAVSVLLRCVQSFDGLDQRQFLASQALVKLGVPALEGCLAVYRDTPDGDVRDTLAAVLSRFSMRDERIYEALVDTLDRTPELGANCLAEYGDAKAIEPMSQLFDALPIRASDNPLANRVFMELRYAIEDLGGALSAAQEAKFEASDEARRRFVAERDVGRSRRGEVGGDGRRLEAASPTQVQRPVTRASPKLGRNAPCWCGSGQKYKKCHLDSDQNTG